MGFIWREDVIVNVVATPTKMSNYLAAGVILPFLVNTAINDFSQIIIANMVWHFSFPHPSESADIAVKIANFDREKIDVDKNCEKVWRYFSSTIHVITTSERRVLERKIFKIKGYNWMIYVYHFLINTQKSVYVIVLLF